MEPWWEKEGKWFDCFEILGVSEDATKNELKKAYRIFAKKNHPDVLNGNKELFERGTLAYNTLSDSKIREKYTEYTKALKDTKANGDSNDKT